MNPIFSKDPGHPVTIMLWDESAGGYSPMNMNGFGRVSQGPLQNFPANNTNGTELPNRPHLTSGVIIETTTGAVVTYFFGVAGSNPSTPPAITKTINFATTVKEPLSTGDAIFITVSSGVAAFRWYLN